MSTAYALSVKMVCQTFLFPDNSDDYVLVIDFDCSILPI